MSTKSQGPGALKIVSIGGGNGLSTLLRGLKRYAKAGEGALDITAIVTVTDDGGSSGRLRREFDVLPPGDIRNCMVALSEDETLLSRLFQYRFSSGRGLKGHSFGNLFLTAMTHLDRRFRPGGQAFLRKCWPCWDAFIRRPRPNVALEATLADGTQGFSGKRASAAANRGSKRSSCARAVPSRSPKRCEAIAEADLITLGPGSLFTSVIPNLLVDGIPQAIAASRGLKAYFVNLMSQPGETTNFRASDHVAALRAHAGRACGRSLIDVCVVNTRPIGGRALDRYQANAARPVENDMENLRKMGLEVIGADLIRMAGQRTPEKIRHDQSVIGAVALELAQRGRRAKCKS